MFYAHVSGTYETKKYMSAAVIDAFMNYALQGTLDKNQSAVLNQVIEIAAQFDPDYLRYILMSPDRTKQFVLDLQRDVLDLDSELAPDHVQACAEHIYSLCCKFVASNGQAHAPMWVHPTVRAFSAFMQDERPQPTLIAKEHKQCNSTASGTSGNSPSRLTLPILMPAFITALKKCSPGKVVPKILSRFAKTLIAAASDVDEDLMDDVGSHRSLVTFVSGRIEAFELSFVQNALATAAAATEAARNGGKSILDDDGQVSAAFRDMQSAFSWLIVDFYRGATTIRRSFTIDDFHNHSPLSLAKRTGGKASPWFGKHSLLSNADDVWAFLFPLTVQLEYDKDFPLIRMSEVPVLLADVTFAVRFVRSVEMMMDYFCLKVGSFDGTCTSLNPDVTKERLSAHVERLRMLRVLMSMVLFNHTDTVESLATFLAAQVDINDTSFKEDALLWDVVASFPSR